MNQERLHRIARNVGGFSHNVRVGGQIEFIKDTGPVRRDIRVQDFDWSQDSLRELAKILWSSQRAQSFAMAAFRLFSKIPSSHISPDGLLGGRGYIQNIKDMRTSMAQAAEVLSSFTDTIHDEINAPHWKQTNTEEIDDIVDSAQEVKANPEQFVREEYQEDTSGENFDEPLANPDAEGLNPHLEVDEEEDDDGSGWTSGGDDDSGQHQTAGSFAETAERDKKIQKRQKKLAEPGEQGSQLPGGTGEQHEGQSVSEVTMHTTTPASGNYASAIDQLMRSYELRTASSRTADSSVDPQSLPGPRIDHIGPGEGGFNDGEEWASDDPAGDALSSGVDVTRPIYEDWCADGVTGYDNPTDQPPVDIACRVSAAPQTYSWLPGADNTKNLDYYALGLTDEDTKWMREHSQPDPPPGLFPKAPSLPMPELWENKF